MRKLLVALLLLSLLSMAGIQTFVLPEVKSCAFSSLEISSGLSLSSILPSAISCFSPAYFAFFIFPVAFALLLLHPGFFREFAGFLSGIFSSRKSTVIVLVILLASLFSFFLAPGDAMLSDAGQFQGVTFSYLNSMRQFSFPDFTFDFYAGSMQFYYYGPAYFIATALFSMPFSDVNLSLKLFLFLSQVGAAVAFFFFANRLLRNNSHSFIAAVAYSLIFEHVAKIAIVGRTILAPVYLLLPLLFLSFEKLADGSMRKLAAIIAISLLVSAIFLTSPADSVFILPFFAVYAFLRLLSLGRLHLLKPLAASTFLFLLLTSFWTVPFFLERDFVSGSARAVAEFVPGFSDYAVRMLEWPGSWGFSQVYYLGVSLLLLSAFAAAFSFRKKGLPLVLSSCLLLSFLFVFFFSGRAATSVVFFLPLLAALGIPRLYSLLSKKFRISVPVFAALLLLVVLVDLAPAAIQPVYADFSYERGMLDATIPYGDGSGRILDLHSNYRTYYPYVSYVGMNVPEVFGIIPEGAPRSFAYAASIASAAAHDVYDTSSALSPGVVQGLFLLNAKYLVIRNEQIGIPADVTFASKRYGFGLERNISVVELNSSPIILSRQLSCCFSHQLDSAESFFTKQGFNSRALYWNYTSSLISAMDVDVSSATASHILSKTANSEFIISSVPLSFSILNYSHSPKRIVAVINASSGAFARLGVSYFPWLKITVNGKRQQPIQTAMNFVAVRVDEGVNEIVVEADISMLRKVMNAVSFAAFIVLLLLLLYRRKTR